ncbi:AdeC/AdeK/OprM family multidrug efflux complex outer membrane factor [Janthinobacterium sp. PC23-8]|uniref:AdeC/AdeK/OprM family multidrug efflux complex outer membrane factor n=1 Tax=Janthinobacterium sp. PC23-8 TaxID=2012679 RepID=UPI000B97AB8A|nr:AdeC/AdeK/OprM family multidrug efflux complex outer membrane factor [Janthinobacterium sp. PC23-8]OYO30220.1 multidrug transporter [Janthinobacterium sp. PC23-8]
MKKSLLSMAALALLAGCSLAPTYERPAAPSPSAWPSGPSYTADAPAGATAVSDIAWRDFFADARLRQVIELALANNRDLRVSILNIEKARATYGIERAALMPTLSAAGGQTATRVPKNQSANGNASITRQYTANLGVSAYELDFFGRVRSLSDSALEQYLGTEEARRAQQITLVSEVAGSYLNLVADQQRLRVAQDTLRSQQASYNLAERRFSAGATSGLDKYNAQTSVELARSDVAVYTSQVALDQNALTLLVGSSVPAELLPQAEFGAVTSLADVPAGVPSEVLQRRPDVLVAERTLRSANANIGAARAAFFPRISLTATAGSASSNLSGLFKAGSGSWSFIPQISLPIFDGGVNRANLDIAKVQREISVAQYEKAIQVAFREVSDALAQRGTIDERLQSQQALVEASTKSYTIQDARYKQGAETYLNALIAQRALYTAQQSLITARLAKSTNLVTLYKVLGGGWQPEQTAVAAAGGGQ